MAVKSMCMCVIARNEHTTRNETQYNYTPYHTKYCYNQLE